MSSSAGFSTGGQSMASDNHAHYSRIGFTVFIGIAAIVGTLVYLGGIRGRTGVFLVETYYDKPVSGLSVGSVVNFRGVKIGEVREISFVGNKYVVEGADNSRIYILMALKEDQISRGQGDFDHSDGNIRYLVDKGLRASVTSSGVTGLSRIEIDVNAPDELPPVPPISWRPEHPYIPSKISLIDNFAVAATKVMNQINRMDMASVWSNISLTASSLSRMTEGAKTMLESRQGDVERLVEDLTATTSALRDLTGELKRNPSLLVRERVPARVRETE